MPKTLTAVGAGWCWFADPRALYSAGRIYCGWVDMQARVVAAQITDDPAAGYPVRRFILSDRSTVTSDDVTADDHASPTLLIRGDRLVAFWMGHGGPQANYRIATATQDAGAFGPVLTAPTPSGSYGNTYPNVVQLGDNRVYLTWRGAANFQPWITRTDSLGNPAHWEAPRHMIAADPGQRPYVKVATSGGSTVHLVYTDGHPRDVPTSLYHAKFSWPTGTFKRSDSSVITTWAALPFPASAGTRIHGGSESARCWVWDVAIDPVTGEPRVLYTVLRSRSVHEYWYARLVNGAWERWHVAEAGGSIAQDGEDGYSGGGCIDPSAPGERLWLSLPSAGIHDLGIWTSDDDGVTWAPDHWPLPPSSEQRVRPVAVRGDPRRRILYLEGAYQTFTDVGTRVVLGDPT